MIDEAASAPADAPERWRRRSIVGGIVGAVVASACCLPTAVAIALGLSLGTAATLSQLLAYQRLFQVAGLAIGGLFIWRILRRSQATCSLGEHERQRERVPFYVFGTFAASFVVLNVVVIPLLEQLPWLVTGH